MKISKTQALTAAAIVSAFLSPLASATPPRCLRRPPSTRLHRPAPLCDDMLCSAPMLNYIAGSSPRAPAPTAAATCSPRPRACSGDRSRPAAARPSTTATPARPIRPPPTAAGWRTVSRPTAAATTSSPPTRHRHHDGSWQHERSGQQPAAAGADNIGTWDERRVVARCAHHRRRAPRADAGLRLQPAPERHDLGGLRGLITVRDTDGALPDIHHEVRARHWPVVRGLHQHQAVLRDAPASTDFATVYGTICIYEHTTPAQPGRQFRPSATGSTGALIESVDNSQAPRTPGIPGLPARFQRQPESYIGAGYDTISVRLLFGCFGGTTKGNGAAT